MGWKIYSLALSILNGSLTAAMMCMVFTDDTMLPARAEPMQTPVSTVMLIVLVLVANSVGALRLMWAEDRV
jgi:hypothetical protein